MTLFKGSGVAIVTPFKENGQVNYEELEKLLEFHVENETDAIIITGTTGEASTLSFEENMEVIGFTVKVIDGRIPVVAGTGSNNTVNTIESSKKAEELGVDGLLVVSPYYNKPTQKGLEAHFTEVANAVNIPIILYCVPGRTGGMIEVETVAKLSKHKNIVGIKDATGNLSYTGEIRRLCGENFAIYSGNDDLIVPVLSLGGVGVISVVANCLPKETHDIVHDYLNGDIEKSRDSQVYLKNFIDNLFSESNPIPVKAAMAEMGFDTETLRLPLTPIGEDNRAKLVESMKKIDLI